MPGQSSYDEIMMYIGGDWVGGSGRQLLPVFNPATEERLGVIPLALPEDLDRALAAAAEGFRTWRATAPQRRAAIVLKAAGLIADRIDHIARITTLEQGKPLSESKAELQRAIAFAEWDATESLRSYGRLIPGQANERKAVMPEPIGPVAAFSPWNFPSSSPMRKISGALAAGCSIILKPSEETPGTAALLVRCFHDAGVPAGVLNLVFGVPSQVSEHLIASPVIRKVAFTGSTTVGKHLANLAAGRVVPALMELGGHAPVIVCEDADPDTAATDAVASKFRNSGQVCVSPTRFYVHERIHDRFLARFAELAGRLKVGNGLEPDVQVGALANARRLDSVEAMVDDALHCGARLVCGGRRLGSRGYFFAPTALADVPDSARIMHEEPFGPVAAIVRFRDLDRAIAAANSLPYGLSAYAYTQSAEVANHLANSLEAGNLSINHFVANAADTPFGGVKESGFGREGGLEGIAAYQTTKHVWHKFIPDKR